MVADKGADALPLFKAQLAGYLFHKTVAVKEPPRLLLSFFGVMVRCQPSPFSFGAKGFCNVVEQCRQQQDASVFFRKFLVGGEA